MTFFDSEHDDRFVVDSRRLLRALLHPELRDQSAEPRAQDLPGAAIYPEMAVIYPELAAPTNRLIASLGRLKSKGYRQRLARRFR